MIRGAPPRSILLTIPGLFAQLFGMFFLPVLVGMVAAAVLDVVEVAETSPVLFGITATLLFPVFMAQILGLLIKSAQELRFHYAHHALNARRVFDVLYTHSRVITPRGWSMLVVSLIFVFASLGMKWASLGVIATFGLFLFYAVVGWTVFTSTFLVHTFERGIGRADSGIERSVQPAVCLTGTDAEEVFRFRRTPVPWGYVLLVEERLPDRLQTESRYILSSVARNAELERRGRLRATPRGLYELGPAKLWYQDVLGITRISVASMATAELKVLPRIRPIEVIDAPRSTQKSPDVRTQPHRFPTEDYFVFREYRPGDDTRRIQWRLSMRAGQLQVRLPETREIAQRDVLIVIDSYISKHAVRNANHGAEEILDAVIDAALGLTRTLVEQGNRVILIAAARSPTQPLIEIETCTARKGTATRWQDLGARIRWQSTHDVPELLESLGENGNAIVITGRFSASPKNTSEGISTTWVFMDPTDALGPPDRHWVRTLMDRPGGPLLALFTRPHPVGSDENGMFRRVRNAWRAAKLYYARSHLRHLATRRIGSTERELASRGDSVYRIEQGPGRVRLRCVSSGSTGLFG